MGAYSGYYDTTCSIASVVTSASQVHMGESVGGWAWHMLFTISAFMLTLLSLTVSSVYYIYMYIEMFVGNFFREIVEKLALRKFMNT